MLNMYKYSPEPHESELRNNQNSQAILEGLGNTFNFFFFFSLFFSFFFFHFYFKISRSELDHSEMEFQETYRQRFIKGFYIGFFQGIAQTAFTYRYYPHIFHPSDFKGISQGSRRKVRSDTVI